MPCHLFVTSRTISCVPRATFNFFFLINFFIFFIFFFLRDFIFKKKFYYGFLLVCSCSVLEWCSYVSISSVALSSLEGWWHFICISRSHCIMRLQNGFLLYLLQKNCLMVHFNNKNWNVIVLKRAHMFKYRKFIWLYRFVVCPSCGLNIDWLCWYFTLFSALQQSCFYYVEMLWHVRIRGMLYRKGHT